MGWEIQSKLLEWVGNTDRPKRAKRKGSHPSQRSPRGTRGHSRPLAKSTAPREQALGQWDGCLRTLAKGPGPGIPAPPFLLPRLQEGEALGGTGRKGKQLDTQPWPALSAGPCSSPGKPRTPLPDLGQQGTSLRVDSGRPGEPSQGARVQQVWSACPSPVISRNGQNGKALWGVTFPSSVGSQSVVV